jgi:hypothetical protein
MPLHPRRRTVLVLILVVLLPGPRASGVRADDAPERDGRVAAVTAIPGLVAFWDFVAREPAGERRFVAHVPPGSTTDYPLDAGNYVRDFWGEGRGATYEDFPLLGRGPFGEAIRIRREDDPSFRPFLLVPRARLHDTPLDIKGVGRSATVVVWAIRESGNHALAGIWHEGTDLKERATEGIRRVERGQRQYALFAGLNKEGSACGHVSENGASSFQNRYALHKCNSAAVAAAVPADAPPAALDAGWHCFAMTFDHERNELTGWLDGVAGDRWQADPQRDGLLSFAANAWLQGRLRRQAGIQPGEDPSFPADQRYEPPEDNPLQVDVISDGVDERVEVREYRFTKVRVTLRRTGAGEWTETDRALIALRLNPWWYPHGIHAPADAASGGPFTIGRVIHSAKSVGFTGWIGGVAVFDRALTATELEHLAAIGRRSPIAVAHAAKAATAVPADRPAADRIRDELWRRFIDRHGVMIDFTALDGTVALPTPDECRGGRPNALGWFQPIENGAMFNGMYMDAPALRWERTRDEAAAAAARRLMEGLLLLNSVSDVKGFVARGVSTDGRSHFPMGSNDQTMPWYYGLWRYWQSGIATPAEKERIRRHLVDTTDAIVSRGWQMPAEPPFGVRGGFGGFGFETSPRRLFVMKLMHAVTGDDAWGSLYRRTLDERNADGVSHLDICGKGMEFTYARTHNWTSCTTVAAIRGLWEMEQDPAVKDVFRRGLVASARLAAESLAECERYDAADPRTFDTDWRRAMMPLWKPQATDREAQSLAEEQLRAFMQLSPRRQLETAFVREPAAAAWIVTLCPDPEAVAPHAATIRAMADEYDYAGLYYCTFFWLEAALLRLPPW